MAAANAPMTLPGTERPPRLRVYISYSRAADSRFADEVAAGLGLLGDYDVAIDRTDIHEGEDWQARLSAQIVTADTVVFVLSARAAQSPTCRFEMKEAERHHKRILPVLAQPLGGTPPPGEVAKLQYIRFDEGRSFVLGLEQLRSALDADRDWLAEHSRLSRVARAWEADGRPAAGLLSGADLRAARAWLESQPDAAPLPTRLHREFIRESDQQHAIRVSAEDQRIGELSGRVTRLQILLGLVALCAFGLGAYIYTDWFRLAESANARAAAEEALIGAVADRQAAELREQRYRTIVAGMLERALRAKSLDDRRAVAPVLEAALRGLAPDEIRRVSQDVATFGQFQRDPDGSFGPKSDEALDNWIEGLDGTAAIDNRNPRF